MHDPSKGGFRRLHICRNWSQQDRVGRKHTTARSRTCIQTPIQKNVSISEPDTSKWPQVNQGIYRMVFCWSFPSTQLQKQIKRKSAKTRSPHFIADDVLFWTKNLGLNTHPLMTRSSKPDPYTCQSQCSGRPLCNIISRTVAQWKTDIHGPSLAPLLSIQTKKEQGSCGMDGY